MALNITKWKPNYSKPKNVTSDCLFSIEIFSTDNFLVVRDCIYKNNYFIQIDDQTEYYRFDIILWQKQ
jgi:hypothetical protein